MSNIITTTLKTEAKAAFVSGWKKLVLPMLFILRDALVSDTDKHACTSMIAAGNKLAASLAGEQIEQEESEVAAAEKDLLGMEAAVEKADADFVAAQAAADAAQEAAEAAKDNATLAADAADKLSGAKKAEAKKAAAAANEVAKKADVEAKRKQLLADQKSTLADMLKDNHNELKNA